MFSLKEKWLSSKTTGNAVGLISISSPGVKRLLSGGEIRCVCLNCQLLS